VAQNRPADTKRHFWQPFWTQKSKTRSISDFLVQKVLMQLTFPRVKGNNRAVDRRLKVSPGYWPCCSHTWKSNTSCGNFGGYFLSVTLLLVLLIIALIYSTHSDNLYDSNNGICRQKVQTGKALLLTRHSLRASF
jgi:hypothetical protein